MPSINQEPGYPANGAKNGTSPSLAPASASAKQTNGAARRLLRLTIRETADPAQDEDRLREVLKLLLEFRGADQVLLKLHSKGQEVQMEAPYTTDCCPDLNQRLQAVLGADAVSVADLP